MAGGFDCDVLIVGAGPTGLMTGIELARRGATCRLIDAADAPFGGSREMGLQLRTLEIFDHIGVSGKIAERAMPRTCTRHRVGRVSTSAFRMPGTSAGNWPPRCAAHPTHCSIHMPKNA